MNDLARLKKDGLYLECVEEQTEELCLVAVKENGWALRFVKEQSEEICLAAVNQNYRAIGFVEPVFFEKACDALRLRALFDPHVERYVEHSRNLKQLLS